MARQIRHARRVRRLALGALLAVLLGALPGYLLIREGVRDPVFTALDALDVPAWAGRHPVSAAAGSRWCVKTCRYRERIADSDRPTAETDAAYQRALRLAGWRGAGGSCPHPADGIYSCWQRDEFVLDLWTRDAICDDAAPASTGPGRPGAAGPTGQARSPAGTATGPARPSGTVASAGPAAPAPGGSLAPGAQRPEDGLSGCPGSKVTIKVTNKIDPRWHQ